MPANEPVLTLLMHPLASYRWNALVALHENETSFVSKPPRQGPLSTPPSS